MLFPCAQSKHATLKQRPSPCCSDGEAERVPRQQAGPAEPGHPAKRLPRSLSIASLESGIQAAKGCLVPIPGGRWEPVCCRIRGCGCLICGGHTVCRGSCRGEATWPGPQDLSPPSSCFHSGARACPLRKVLAASRFHGASPDRAPTLPRLTDQGWVFV